MRAIDQFTFHDEAAAAGTGQIMPVRQGDSLVATVKGTFSGVTLTMQGQQEIGGAWYDLSVIELAEFEIQKNITEAGAYMVIGVSGFINIRANLSAITTGRVSVAGRLSVDG